MMPVLELRRQRARRGHEIGHSDRIGAPTAGVGIPPFGVRRQSSAPELRIISSTPFRLILRSQRGEKRPDARCASAGIASPLSSSRNNAAGRFSSRPKGAPQTRPSVTALGKRVSYSRRAVSCLGAFGRALRMQNKAKWGARACRSQRSPGWHGPDAALDSDRSHCATPSAHAKTSDRHSGLDAGIQVPGMASCGNRRGPLQAPTLMSCYAENKPGARAVPPVCRPWTTGFRGPTRNDGIVAEAILGAV